MRQGRAGGGTALVIGATGLIGAETAAQLAARGWVVTGTSRDVDEADLGLDLAQPASVEAALEEASPDAIVMLAGSASTAAGWADPPETFSANTLGVFNLLESLRKFARSSHLLYASSGAVYGFHPAGAPDRPFEEGDDLRPASPYAASKAAAETLCRQYAAEHGLAIAIARIFNQAGPGLSPEQAPSAFAREIVLAEARGDPGVELAVGNPGAERDYTDVRDTAQALAGLLENGGTDTINVCSGQTTRLDSIVKGLSSSTPVDVEIRPDPDRAHPVDPQVVAGCNRRLLEATDWEPQIGLNESLTDLLEDWRSRV